MVQKQGKLSERKSIKNHIFQGVDLVKDLIYSFNNVIVYFDPDVDGCIAGLLVCRFCVKHNIKFQWYINKNRSHDWTLPLEKVSGKDIIAVDFIITSVQVMNICDAGCNIVSMDHHVNGENLIQYESDYGTSGVVVNNQYTNEDADGRYLSGAGVVFETLIQLDPEFNTKENRALVGITLLSDVRDIENPLAEGYLYTLYTHKYRGYIKYLIDFTIGEKDYGFGVPRMDRGYVDYKFSPAINACLRFGEEEQVVNFFLGSHVLDLTCREKQKQLVKDISEKLKVINFKHLRVCYFYEKDFIEYAKVLSSFVGLVASKHLDGQSRSVICYLISGNSPEEYQLKRASFRGNINGLDYQNALGVLFKCLGHKSAFGIKEMRPTKDTFVKANEIVSRVEVESNYHREIREITNLSFMVNKIFKVAEDNLYLLSQNQIYYKYLGKNIKKHRSGANYVEYSVDGIPVMCFDKNVTFENGYIVPILERGFINFYLQ